MHRRRRVDLKRSKRGCLTCRVRRKKCPEDFQEWGDGSYGCSQCSQRGQYCQLSASATSTRTGNSATNDREATQISTASPGSLSHHAGTSVTSSSTDGPSQRHYGAPTSSVDVVMGAPFFSDSAGLNHLLQAATTTEMIGNSTPSLPYSTHDNDLPTKILAQSSTDHDINPRNGWLENFFGEFMQLTELTLQRYQGNNGPSGSRQDLILSPAGSVAAAETPSAPRLSTATTMAPPGMSSSQSNASSSMSSPGVLWSESQIDRAVQQDDLDELLVRWSPIYEIYLGAIVDDSNRADEMSLLDRLMEITKSCNICKASMVACCLAYKDLITRELQSTRPISRFVKYLIGSSKQRGGDVASKESSSVSSQEGSKDSASYASRYANAWLKFALDGFNRIRTTMPLATRMLSLLNIRYATICLLGGKFMLPLAAEVQRLVAEIRVDVAYIYKTCDSGTTLAFLVQALAFANVMDTAAMRHTRSSVVTKCHSSVLSEDALKMPHANFHFVTALSVGLWESIKRVSDLSADINEGIVFSQSEIDSRSDQIKQCILSSEIALPNDLSQVNARMRAFVLHELWRQAVLIQLYQDVYHLGPMASRLQQVLSQMYILSETLSSTERYDTERNDDGADVWDMSMVWFLACTASVTEKHRTTFLHNLESLGCERAIIDNVVAIKLLWRVMDDTGKVTDWRIVLAEHGMYPCYTF